MMSVKLNIKRISGKIIPFEYNYFIGSAIYRKLLLYEHEVMPLHNISQIGVYTFSNIINPIKKVSYGDNGIDIDSGYIIFRTLDDKIISYLRLAILEDPVLKIKDVDYRITRVETLDGVTFNSDTIKFKTLSPVLVRDFIRKNLYVSKENEVPGNLKLVLEHQMAQFFGITNPLFTLDEIKTHRKTIRISNNGKKESITTGFNISGVMKTTSEVANILYYKGLGSKTSLGLGCWKVM